MTINRKQQKNMGWVGGERNSSPTAALEDAHKFNFTFFFLFCSKVHESAQNGTQELLSTRPGWIIKADFFHPLLFLLTPWRGFVEKGEHKKCKNNRIFGSKQPSGSNVVWFMIPHFNATLRFWNKPLKFFYASRMQLTNWLQN